MQKYEDILKQLKISMPTDGSEESIKEAIFLALDAKKDNKFNLSMS